jgi:uncharacterized protein (TIGR02246 family)
MRATGLILLALFALNGAVAAQGAPDGAKLAAAYAEAFNARDAAKVARLYAEDGVWMPPDAPMVKGRAAIETALKELMAEPLGRLAISVLESDAQGNRATFVGTFTLTSGNPGGLTMMGVGGGSVAPGKYIVVYRRVGGEWLIAFNIANYDRPQAPKSPAH